MATGYYNYCCTTKTTTTNNYDYDYDDCDYDLTSSVHRLIW